MTLQQGLAAPALIRIYLYTSHYNKFMCLISNSRVLLFFLFKKQISVVDAQIRKPVSNNFLCNKETNC